MIDWLKGLFSEPPVDEPLPQLDMLRDHVDDLPPIVVPDGYELRSYVEGDEQAWCDIMEGNVGRNWTRERCRMKLIDDPRFERDNLFFAVKNDRPVASACAWKTTVEETVIGEVHMVAALESHRGKGLGHLVNAAVLHRLKDLGFQKIHLKTDDYRLAAINSYLKAGFDPLNTHISHAERWEAILDRLGDGQRS